MSNLKSIFYSVALCIMMLGIATRTCLARQESHKSGPARVSAEVSAPAELTAHPEAPEGDELTLQRASVWVLIIFVVFLVAIVSLFWTKMIGPGLKSRRKRIEDDIQNAKKELHAAEEALRRQKDQLAGAEARIREMLSKAESDGARLAADIRTHAQKEASDARDRAQRDIESSKNAAIREVYDQTAILSTEIAEKILRRNVNPDDQRELVRQSLEQLQTIKS